MSWFNGFWNNSNDSNINIDEELSKFQYCNNQQVDLVCNIVNNLHKFLIHNQYPLFTENNAEQGKIVVRRCIWSCYYFSKNIDVIRQVLEIILLAIRRKRLFEKEKDEVGVSYLHLVYTDILFELFPDNNEKTNIKILLNLLSIPDFQIRYSLTSILQIIMKNNKTIPLQNEILGDPMAVAIIVELLEDKETIRVQSLNLLLALTTSINEDLQKLIAFSGGFEKSFNIINTASYWDSDGVGIPNCLILVGNLLKKNILSQNYFRETSCINKLIPLLSIESTDTWLLTDQKAKIVEQTLNIVYYLVSGNNPDILRNQNELGKNILNLVITWALDRINSQYIRSKALFALGALLYNHSQNRSMFSLKTISIARADTPQPTLHRLLTLAFHSKFFAEQISAYYAFKCYLHDNNESQLAIITTLTPPPDSSHSNNHVDVLAGENSIGRQLLNALKEGYKQPITSWISSCILANVIKDNDDCKQVALKIPLSLENPSENLLGLLLKLIRSNQALVKDKNTLEYQIASIGFIRLLCIWMYQFPSLVVEFLKTKENLPLLIDLINQDNGNIHLKGLCALLLGLCFMFNENEESEDISTNRFAIHGIICHRIGLDKYITILDGIRNSSTFIDAEKLELSELDYSSINYDYLLYDTEFIEFIKNTRDQLLRDLRSPNKRKLDALQKDLLKEKDSIILSLKEEIKDLNNQLNESKLSKDKENNENIETINKLNEANEHIKELQNELKSNEDSLQSLSLAYNDLETYLSQSQSDNNSTNTFPINLTEKYDEYISQINTLTNEKNTIQEKYDILLQNYNQIQNDMKELSLKTTCNNDSLHIQDSERKEEKISQLELQITNLQNELDNSKKSETNAQNSLSSMQKRFQSMLLQQNELKNKVESIEVSKEELTNKIREISLENETLKQKISVQSSFSNTNDELINTQKELYECTSKYKALQKEHEDLLIMFVREESESTKLREQLNIQ